MNRIDAKRKMTLSFAPASTPRNASDQDRNREGRTMLSTAIESSRIWTPGKRCAPRIISSPIPFSLIFLIYGSPRLSVDERS